VHKFSRKAHCWIFRTCLSLLSRWLLLPFFRSKETWKTEDIHTSPAGCHRTLILFPLKTAHSVWNQLSPRPWIGGSLTLTLLAVEGMRTTVIQKRETGCWRLCVWTKTGCITRNFIKQPVFIKQGNTGGQMSESVSYGGASNRFAWIHGYCSKFKENQGYFCSLCQLRSDFVLRGHSVNIDGTLSLQWVYIQWTFSEHLENIQWIFSEHWGYIRRPFKWKIQRKFSEHSKNISSLRQRANRRRGQTHKVETNERIQLWWQNVSVYLKIWVQWTRVSQPRSHRLE
jgi:hypothetical protein